MRLSDAGRADQHEIGGLLEEVGFDELHDLVPGDFGVEGPVEVVEELGPADAGHFHQVLGPAAFAAAVFFVEEPLEERPLGLGKGLRTLEQPELFPELR